jgi:hypothetical protein
MDFIQKVSQFENYCEHQTRIQLESNLNLLEEMLNFYSNLLEKQIKDKTDIKTHELAIILIHAKMIKTLNCNSDLLKKGHYNEFRSLLRDVFELIFLSQYIIVNPEKGEPWLDGEEIKHRHVANTLNLPTDIREIYGMLCDYTHPNFNGTKENLIMDKKSEDIDFLRVPIFRKKIAKLLIILQIHFAFMAINQFFVCFKKYNNFNKDDEKQLKQIKLKLPKQKNSWTHYCRELKIEV